MDLGIAGKWALVGGASKGLGWGCARALALEGVNVVMVARGAEVLNKAVDDLRLETGGKVQLIEVKKGPLLGDLQAISQSTESTLKVGQSLVMNPPGDLESGQLVSIKE